MAVVYGWVKNIVFFYILMTAVLHLLPKSSYQKYVRFFGGMLLVVLLVSPLLDLIYHQDYLLDKISYEAFWQELDAVQLDLTGMEESQKQAYQREYEKAIGTDIALMAQEESLFVRQVSVRLTGEYALESIALDLALAEEEEGVHIEKITLGDNSQEYPQVMELKKKIMDFYKVDEGQVKISMQEG